MQIKLLEKFIDTDNIEYDKDSVIEIDSSIALHLLKYGIATKIQEVS